MADSIAVQLSLAEITSTAVAGVMRQVSAIKHSRKQRHGCKGSWGVHIEGVLGELAVAKALNRYWSGNRLAPATGDVGEGIEVRTTAHENGRLILHPTDPGESVFILVTGKDGLYRLRGWIYGKDGKDERYWSDVAGNGRWAFFVPQGDLRPLSELEI